MSRYADAIPIIPYNPAFPRWFSQVREFIITALPFDARVEHIGSTAVPGLAGKGIIDCMVTTHREWCPEAQARIAAAGLNRHGHSHPAEDWWYAGGEISGEGGETIPVHAHITWAGSERERSHLAFRRYLQNHPEEAAEYLRLKHEWRELAEGDRVAFTDMKAPYVASVVQKAYAEASRGRPPSSREGTH